MFFTVYLGKQHVTTTPKSLKNFINEENKYQVSDLYNIVSSIHDYKHSSVK